MRDLFYIQPRTEGWIALWLFIGFFVTLANRALIFPGSEAAVSGSRTGLRVRHYDLP